MSINALTANSPKAIEAQKTGNPQEVQEKKEEFDFFNYLVGLQGGAPQQEANPLQLNQTESQVPGLLNPNDSEKNLMSLFNSPMENLTPEKILLENQGEEVSSEFSKDAILEFGLQSYQESLQAVDLEEVADGDPSLGLATSVLSPSINTENVLSVAPNQNSPIQTAEPIAQVYDRLQSLVSSGNGKMTVALNPPELGQMEIEVITRGGKVEIEMTSDNHLAKHLLEANLPELKRTLGIQDLDLARVEVNVGDPGFQSHQQSERQEGSSEREWSSPSRWETREIERPMRMPQAYAMRAASGALDIQI